MTYKKIFIALIILNEVRGAISAYFWYDDYQKNGLAFGVVDAVLIASLLIPFLWKAWKKKSDWRTRIAIA